MVQLDARPIGDKMVAGSIPPDPATLFRRIDHKIFSTSFSPFSSFTFGSCQFLAK